MMEPPAEVPRRATVPSQGTSEHTRRMLPRSRFINNVVLMGAACEKQAVPYNWLLV